MDIETVLVKRQLPNGGWEEVTTEDLKDKEVQSYRGLPYGAPGNTPMHLVDYDLSCVVPYLRTPTREELCMSPGALSPNRSARIDGDAATSDSVDSAFVTDSPNWWRSPSSSSSGDGVFSCNMFLSDWVDSSGSSITCAQKTRAPPEVDTQRSSGIDSYEDSETEGDDENSELNFDTDLCECGSECETTNPPRCNDSLFDGI